MATLYDTILGWADGQNTLNAGSQDRRQMMQVAVEALLGALRNHASLADLAVAYYGDDKSWQRVGEEFMLPSDEALAVRDAAHWQRFMEIRHRRTARRR